MPATAGDQRQKQFKNVGKHEEMRRRRAEGSIELRKQKKDEQLMKRRNVELSPEDNGPADVTNEKSPPPSFSLEKCKEVLEAPEQIEEYEKAVENLRKLLSRSQTPPVDSVISAGLVPLLIQALASESSKVQFEAAWALTNVVSGTTEQTLVVVNQGGITALVQLLFSPHIYVAEQAAWALGNIAGESAQMRDKVIEAGAIPPMIALVDNDKISVEFLRTLAWTFSNFCRHKRPPVRTEYVRPVIPVIAYMLHSAGDKQVVSDACWALSYFTDGPDERITLALEAGVLPSLINLLDSDDRKLAAPAVRTLGNIVTGTDEQTQIVVDSDVLRMKIVKILSTAQAPLAKECCWMISNVLAGTQSQIQAVIEAGLIPILIVKLDKGDFKTQSEAAWAITNLLTGGSKEQIVYVVQQNVIPPFTKLLTCKDPKIIQVILDGLRNMLELAKQLDQLDQLCLVIEEAGALDYIEELQQHENQDVYKKALYIIDSYFGGDEEEDEVENKENCQPVFNAPQAAPQEGFNF